MGRPKKEFEFDDLYDSCEQGLTQREMASKFDVSIPTIAKKISTIQQDQGVLMKYRTLQSLELTKLQSKILSNITDDKIHEAPLRDLVVAFKILKDKEHLIEGKPSEIKGLVSYLIEIEKEEAALEDGEILDAEVKEIEGSGSGSSSETEDVKEQCIDPESEDFVSPFSIED
jgi:transcriptional regulator with XRE-family HTH domain